MAKIAETPLMKQYLEMKRKHPDAILLFRVGDFYETFSSDAITASEVLGITLTRRANGSAAYVELAGFPHHALDTYLPKLVRAGYRVAICEQLEDPKTTKKLVKRGITELVTPGVSLNDTVLDNKQNNFVAALHFGAGGTYGVAFLDISTGEFLTAQGDIDYVDKLLVSFAPKELLLLRGSRKRAESLLSAPYLTFELDDWVFTSDSANERLLRHFGTSSMKGFGLSGMHEAIIAAGAIIHYLDITQHTSIGHIDTLTAIDSGRYVRLDRFTIRNLELVQPLADEGMSLLEVLDRTITPMGARLLHQWVVMPLKDVDAINRRLDVVDFFFRNPELCARIATNMERIGDLGRLVSKVATQRATPRDVVQIRYAMQAIDPIKADLLGADSPVLAEMGTRIDPCYSIVDRIRCQIAENPPLRPGAGGVIAHGVNSELDELREIAGSGKKYLENIREREIARTGIPSLKIGFNNVFGYYIEVTNTHRDKVPADWVRRQTLTNAERYITPELKEYEEKILGAEARISSLEESLFNDLLADLSTYVAKIKTNAVIISRLDCLVSLTRVAAENRYVRPVVDDSFNLDLVEARHPVIEKRLPAGEPYIANTVHLDNDGNQILMITGPNMSGKSALLRQTALNVIMAQIGSFVAADSARIGIVDKIFTRVGASDNISLGESTFMVEMNEAATIVNNMSRRSLILFDELGRGTSTYDGISIARAIVEHIHDSGGIQPKTLFATHYHELNEMEQDFPRVRNFHVSVKEINGKVVFLRRLEKGGSEHSFGIHVARLAGMPRAIVERADAILSSLEATRRSVENADAQNGDTMKASEAMSKKRGKASIPDSAGIQLSFFQLDDPVLTQVRDIIMDLDVNNLTPMEALNRLHDIKQILTGK